MISNLDIERKKHHPNLSRKQSLDEYESKILNSKRLAKFMEKLLKAYADGKDGLKLPHFLPKKFPELVAFRFNSYRLGSSLIYDYLNNFMFFM